MSRDDILRMAREAGFANVRGGLMDNGELSDYWDCWPHQLERFFHLAHAAGEQAERDRTSRLVQDMQAELQTLRDRLAKQKPRIWVYRDNPGITTDREPNNSKLWEPLGNIV